MWGSVRSLVRVGAIVVVAGLVAACSVPVVSAPGQTEVARTPGPAGVDLTPGPAVVECLGGLDQATCATALPVVLDAVRGSGWTPVHVWINSGQLAPAVEMLFDPTAMFPAQQLPEGGAPAGNAEVAFAETDQHAGMNLVAIGDRITADLVGYAVPHADWCSGTCPSASTVDGPFTLELVLPRLEWKADEPLIGTAILSYAGAEPVAVSGSSGLIVFRYAEVGGTRVVEPVWPADCAHREIDPATPLNEQLSKSGAVVGTEPDAGFLRAFLGGPDVRLPAGTWDISAIALFSEGGTCSGRPHEMTAPVRITVTD